MEEMEKSLNEDDLNSQNSLSEKKKKKKEKRDSTLILGISLVNHNVI